MVSLTDKKNFEELSRFMERACALKEIRAFGYYSHLDHTGLASEGDTDYLQRLLEIQNEGKKEYEDWKTNAGPYVVASSDSDVQEICMNRELFGIENIRLAKGNPPDMWEADAALMYLGYDFRDIPVGTVFVQDVSTQALKGISLEIERGSLVSITGASGSGKTTLLNIIGCMDIPTAGRYVCDKTEVSALKAGEVEKFRKENISFVFQQFALLDDYTVFENVELPLRVKNLPKKERKRQIREVLAKFGIAELEKKYPTQISGGQQQRCAIARAVAAGTDIILADEPTGALDSKTSSEISSLLKELNRSGKTVIIVTHDMKIAEQADRIIRIEDGRIVE